MLGLIAGGVVSGVLLGLLSGLSAPVPAFVRYPAVVAVAVLAALRDAGVIPVALPQNARQVPREVLRHRPRRGALRFGFELGTGVRTYLSASAPYVLAVAIFLAGPRPHVAALAGAGFGAGRAVTPLIRRASGAVEGWDADLLVRLRAITVAGCAVLAAAFGLLFLHR